MVTHAKVQNAMGRAVAGAMPMSRRCGTVLCDGPPPPLRSACPRAPSPMTADAATARIDSATDVANAADMDVLVGKPCTIAPAPRAPPANPTVRAMPAMVTPGVPRRRPAQAVPALIIRPTPRPTMKRPVSRPAVVSHRRIRRLPAAATAPPASTTGRAPTRSASIPPARRQGTRPTA